MKVMRKSRPEPIISLFYTATLVRRSDIHCSLGGGRCGTCPQRFREAPPPSCPMCPRHPPCNEHPPRPQTHETTHLSTSPMSAAEWLPLGSLKPSCRNHSVAAQCKGLGCKCWRRAVSARGPGSPERRAQRDAEPRARCRHRYRGRAAWRCACPPCRGPSPSSRARRRA